MTPDGNAPAVLCQQENLDVYAVDDITLSRASVLQFVLQRTRIVERAKDLLFSHLILAQ
jgi:hypothetical protein